MNQSHTHQLGANFNYIVSEMTNKGTGAGMRMRISDGAADLPLQALSSGGTEARPVNISIKLWKRTA